MLVTEKVHNFNVAYDPEYTHSIREYYLYCVLLFKEQIWYEDWATNIIFGDSEHDFKNDLPTKRIVFQYEHTLVKPGGRDADGFPVGQVSIGGNGFYLVRLANYPLIERSDLVVEYSIPNQFNVGHCTAYPHYNNRRLYISPCLYDIPRGTNRPLSVSTNFYDINQPRRSHLLGKLRGVDARNYTGVYGSQLAALYDSTKILVNIHQTDHHDTLEELRVLPALRRGAIVVAEHSALEKLVPYHDHIIWANYNEIPDVVADVLGNYDRYRERIFNDALYGIFQKLEEVNRMEIERSLKWLR